MSEDIIKDLSNMDVSDDQWVYECAQKAIHEIKRLNAENARLREALELGVKMRAAQCAYFSDRTRNNLIASKQVEEEFDAISRAALAEKEST
jgi:hypothetical protein